MHSHEFWSFTERVCGVTVWEASYMQTSRDRLEEHRNGVSEGWNTYCGCNWQQAV